MNQQDSTDSFIDPISSMFYFTTAYLFCRKRGNEDLSPRYAQKSCLDRKIRPLTYKRLQIVYNRFEDVYKAAKTFIMATINAVIYRIKRKLMAPGM